MKKLEIDGGKKLNGSISIQGAKNSVLPILSASILVNGISIIHNCPNLSDVDVTIKILRYLGAKVQRQKDTLIVDTKNIFRSNILEQYMSELRSSIIFLGALASRMGNACVYLPGGCDIGLRPIDLHLKGLKALGYNISTNANNICAYKEKFTPAEIVLSFPSVGATENIILASVLEKGTTTIINAAREPEIADLISFLNSAGAKITGSYTPTITIEGVPKLYDLEHTIIPDRIEAATYMSACAICKGDIELNNINYNHLLPTVPIFEKMGCVLEHKDNSLRMRMNSRPLPVQNIETMAYPGFPTDCQAPIMSALTVASGTSLIKETIFENRFRHIEQLNLFGADIKINDRTAVINGVKELYRANAKCTDLRGGSAVVISALSAIGKSNIYDINHIDRGYENIETKLSKLGADIKRLEYEKD